MKPLALLVAASRDPIQGAPPDRTLWSAWKPEELDAIRAPIATSDTKAAPALH